MLALVWKSASELPQVCDAAPARPLRVVQTSNRFNAIATDHVARQALEEIPTWDVWRETMN
jgi:hypothetical protein